VPAAQAAAVLRLCEVAEAHFRGWAVPGGDPLRALLLAQQEAAPAEDAPVPRASVDAIGMAMAVDEASLTPASVPLAAEAVGLGTAPRKDGVAATADARAAGAAAARARAVLLQTMGAEDAGVGADAAGAGARHGGRGAVCPGTTFTDMAALLESLREAGGDGDLPAFELEREVDAEEGEVAGAA